MNNTVKKSLSKGTFKSETEVSHLSFKRLKTLCHYSTLLLILLTTGAVKAVEMAEIEAKIDSEAPLWMRYVKISPDGERIAFSYKGDIYTVDSSGGEAKAITTNSAHDYMPIWSNDGESIAFSSDRHGSFDIYIVDADGGEPVRLTYHSGSEKPSTFTPDDKSILFSATIYDDIKSIQFPYALLSELYSVPANGGRISQILTTPAEEVSISKDGNILVYTDCKGYEDRWRKHHTSAITRDLWSYNIKDKTDTKITSFNGEDREGVIANDDNNTLFYLSEKSGSFNIWRTSLNGDKKESQISQYSNHPVRFLSYSSNTLCYTFDGEIYTQSIDGGKAAAPKKVEISIIKDSKSNKIEYINSSRGGTEMSISPDGKEIAFIVRGDVFVTSVDYGVTKRVTATPEQERSISFSPDGKRLLYASERDGSWNIYTSSIKRSEEINFATSSLITEEAIVDGIEDQFQPTFSPDGKEVAYLEERTTLKVYNIDKKSERVVLKGKFNYSYSDGDQTYKWSPDSKWFLVKYNPNSAFMSDIALVNASGEEEPTNLTKSGYSDNMPKWSMDGKAMIWQSDRYGYRSHGSWGSHSDVLAMFFSQDAFDKFKMSKNEYTLYKDLKKQNSSKKEKKEELKKEKKEEKDSIKSKTPKEEPLDLNIDNLKDRTVRLTTNSSSLSDMILTKDGETLFFLSRFEGGYDLWTTSTRTHKTTLIKKLSSGGGAMQMDKSGQNIFFVSGGSVYKLSVASKKATPISLSASYTLDKSAEKEYMFNHIWLQVKKKFYDPNIHGIDWDMYREAYKKFLPHIDNNYDFSEMVSELLGELNGSHTGCRYRPNSGAEATASLGVLYDWNYSGDGLKISEILKRGPLSSDMFKVKPGDIIKSIDGVTVAANEDFYKLLNRKSGKSTLLEITNERGSKSRFITVKPISLGAESTLLYKRWVARQNELTDSISGGTVGYVHVQGMNSPSFRSVYSEALGEDFNKKALVVDTRFNGGGWLHDDLATFLSGKIYATFSPRDQVMGHEPLNKWSKPSAVLVSEGNYSDAYGFPYTYQTLGIGNLVGMPIPGTMTAVWWETLQDGSLVFGIPQVGMKNMQGEYLENKQIEPEIEVRQDYKEVRRGRDQQLEEAVKSLM